MLENHDTNNSASKGAVAAAGSKNLVSSQSNGEVLTFRTQHQNKTARTVLAPPEHAETNNHGTNLWNRQVQERLGHSLEPASPVPPGRP